MMSEIGLTVPRTLETCATATIFVRSESSRSYSSITSSPASFMGMTLRLARFSSQIICQGTMLEWCSMAETMTSSPARRYFRP